MYRYGINLTLMLLKGNKCIDIVLVFGVERNEKPNTKALNGKTTGKYSISFWRLKERECRH